MEDDKKQTVVQIEPTTINPRGFAQAANFGLKVSRPLYPQVEQLKCLKDYDMFYLDYRNYEDEFGDRIIAVLTRDKVVLKTKEIAIPYEQQRADNRINDLLHYLDEDLRIAFTAETTPARSEIYSEGISLGSVQDGGYTFKNTFTAKSCSNKKFKIVPQGKCAGFPCCIFNGCCMSEYTIFEETKNGREKVGSITCGEMTQIDLNANGKETLKFDNPSKAVLISGAMVIHELYFKPCCGRNIGDKGGYCWCAIVGGIAMSMLISLIVLFMIGTL